MSYYVIENDEQKVYKDILFSTHSAASDVIDALEKKNGKTYWINSLTPIENIGLVKVINDIETTNIDY